MTKKNTPVQFSPVAGCPILLQPSGQAEKYKTFFIGMELGRYLVVSMAPLLDRLGESSKSFERGRSVRVFFTRDGVVQGYTVRVQGFTTTPFRHLYLTYPDEGSSYNLRQSDRVETHLPGMIKAENMAAKCMVSNLSSGGCGVLIDPAYEERFERLDSGENVLLRFQFNTHNTISDINCQLTSNKRVLGKLLAGLRFTYMDDATEQHIEEFVRFVAEHRV